MLKEIQVKCKGSMYLELEQLEVIQGDLKNLSKENYNKLRKQIIEQGFSAPFFIWRDDSGPKVKYKIIDGTQRYRVLTELKRSEGYKIPKLPVAEIEAETEFEAKKKLLSFVAQYGELTSEGLFKFISDSNIDLPTLEDFRFPEINLDSFKAEFFDMPLDSDKEGAQELDESEFSEFEHKCPKCGLEFNDKT
jgi:hypothetical protein